MGLFKKIFVVLLILLALFISAGIFTAKRFEKEIINYFVKDLNKFVTSEIRIKKVDVTFLKNFPNISIHLNNAFIESKEQSESDTLFFAEDIFVQFDVSKLVKKEYVIKSIDIKKGICNLEISGNGEKNYIFWKIPEKKETNINLKLEKIKLNDLSFNYLNKLKLFKSAITINNTSLTGSVKNKDWDFDIEQDLTLKEFILKKNSLINQNRKLSTKISLRGNSEKLEIENGGFSIDKSHYQIIGEINNLQKPALDISITGNNVKLSEAIDLLLTQEISKKIKGSGKVDFMVNLKGKLSQRQLPHIFGKFKIQNGEMFHKKEKITLKNVSLSGEFDNHNKKTLDYSSLIINSFQYSIDNNNSIGKLSIHNFHKPTINLDIKGKSPVNVVFKPIEFPKIESIDGFATYDLKLKGELETIKSISKKHINYFDIKGEVNLENCNINLNNRLEKINKLNGKFIFNDITNIKNLGFFVNKNDFVINGNIKNLNDYLLLDHQLKADIAMFSNHIDITPLIKTQENDKKIKKSDEIKALELPEKLAINGNFTINNFKLSNFEATKCRGKMNYKPGLLTLNAVFFESMDGNINGGGVLAQTPDNNFTIRGQSKLNNINITKMMQSFNNFGQSVINHNHISGELSGNITISSSLKNNFGIDKKSINLNSYLEITNGRLANFTPLMGLSKFFKTEELADLQFSRFENSIAISDKTIYFTDMKFNSSVTDLMGSGMHRFDNSYEYKVKIKLSDLLSKKAKPEITETPFGKIEQEELKKTYIPIIITGENENYKVTYDFKETRNNIKTNIQNEKKTLKTVFKNEFGRQKTDSLSKVDTTKKKKKTFEIEWEEEDN